MDPRQKILADVDLEQSKVHFSKNPIVLLCGGHVPEKEHADANEPPVRSLRDAVKRKALQMAASPHIFRPEEIKSWHEDGVFRNLMDFEADLGSVCSLVAIAVESEGAIAELGAFSQLPDFNKKLIVFVPEEYAGASSFINLGILRHIKDKHGTGVKVYPWSPKFPSDISDDVVSDVLEDIAAEILMLQKTQAFNVDNIHLIVLIYELLRLFVALKEKELIDSISSLGREVHRDDLRRKLFLLQEFRLVRKIEYSDSTFYACDDDTFHSLRFVLKSGIAVDPLRLRVECVDYYKITGAERSRNRAIDRAKLGGHK